MILNIRQVCGIAVLILMVWRVTDAAGFTIGNVGYLCTGYRGSTKDRLKDCWAYDIEANSWTQCTSMPDAAPARNAATGFAVGTKGYIATGYDATKRII